VISAHTYSVSRRGEHGVQHRNGIVNASTDLSRTGE
jgi:hypothetical protein